MRKRTIAGLGFAGIGAATALALGGVAYAGTDGDTNPARTLIVDESSRTATSNEGTPGAPADRDCPEKGGSNGGESGAPATPEQPAAAPELL